MDIQKLLSKKTSVFLIAITLTGLFFYTFRLKETQLFRNDPARDTLKILKIWQEKEITMIGPPISFTQHTTREAYLGSLFLYIGLIGLLFYNWDPVGAVFPTIFFFTLSIPVFYFLISKLTNSFWQKAVGTILYALSPITVTHARFFWNPNLIIPFSVFFWYLILANPKSKFRNLIYCFLAGIIAGMIFNFHYLATLPLIVYIGGLIFYKQFKRFFALGAGFITGILPILFFEIKNNFYLSKALLNNLSEGRAPAVLGFGDWLYYFLNIFLSIFGLKQSEIDFPVLFTSVLDNPFILLFVTLLILYILIRKSNKAEKEEDKINFLFWPMLGIAFLVTVYFSSGNPIRLRYLFGIYPLLIWLIVKFISRARWLIILLLIPAIATSITIITNEVNLVKNFISLPLIEDICREIVSDKPEGNYNITENIKGDARAMSFRYCVTKDAKVKPHDELSYNNLTSLYVISPSFDKIYKENRWEFYASGPWELIKTSDFGEVKLFKFIKEKDEKN